MNKRFNQPPTGTFTRDLLIGLGEKSVRKMYYPELQQRMSELEHFRLLLDQAPDAIFLVEADTGLIIDANLAARNWCSAGTAGIIGTDISEWLVYKDSLNAVKPFEEWRYIGNRTVPFEISTRRVNSQDKDFFVIMARDISERKEAENSLRSAHEEMQASYEELEALYDQLSNAQGELRIKVAELQVSQAALAESESRYRLAMEGSNDAIWDWDIHNDLWSISPEWIEKLGIPQIKANDYSFWENRVHQEDQPKLREAFDNCLAGKSDHIEVEYRFLVLPEKWIWILVKGKVLYDAAGKPVRMSGSHTDITLRKNQDEYIRHIAYHDFLTGLPNRLSITEASAAAIKKAESEKSIGAIFFLDIDNFKLINDSWGHSSGDELLVEVANRLRDYFLPEYYLARIGGDEFVILIDSIQPAQVGEWAEKILALFDKPVFMRGIQLALSSSIGVALFSAEATADEVMRNADTALHKAKAAGKKTWRLYEPKMQEDTIWRVNLEFELNQALVTNQFLVFFQPQIRLDSGEVQAFEALIRWAHP